MTNGGITGAAGPTDSLAIALGNAAERTEAISVLLWTELARDLPGWHLTLTDDVRRGHRTLPEVPSLRTAEHRRRAAGLPPNPRTRAHFITRWLVDIDRWFAAQHSDVFDSTSPCIGVSGDEWRAFSRCPLHRFANPEADVPSERQPPTLFEVVRHFQVVPTGSIGGFEHQPLVLAETSLTRREQSLLRDRLQEARSKPSSALLAPLVPEYAEVTRDPLPKHMHLRLPTNESDLHRCALDLLSQARQEGASIVVFPELVATTELVQKLADDLQASDFGPALVVIGGCHRPRANKRSANIAVVLGPKGGVVFTHQKMTQFGREHLALGSVFTTLATPLGHVGVAICLDTFQGIAAQRIDESPVSLLLVPSMSNTLSAHETPAKARRSKGIATLVSNWWLDPSVGDLGASKAWITGSKAHQAAGLHEALTVPLRS
jgi:hypothetical protein